MQWEALWITDGVVTNEIDLTTGPYSLIEYRPTVPRLRKGSLGDDPYDDVIDTIRINVTNTTADAARRDLERIYRLIDQAEQWWNGAPVNQVRVRGRLQAAVIGTGQLIEWVVKGWGNRDPITTPEQQQTPQGSFTFQDVNITFLKRGRGLQNGVQSVLASPATASCMDVFNVTFNDDGNNNMSPFSIFIGGSPIFRNNDQVWVAISPSIAFAEAEAGSGFGGGGTQLASFADAANYARGGAVMRYTADVIPALANNRIPISIASDARLVVPSLAFRKNQANAVFDVSVTAWDISNRALSTTLTQRVSTTATGPQLMFFQPLAVRNPITYLTVTITPITAVTGNTFDVDWVSLVQVGDPRGTIYRFGTLPDYTNGSNIDFAPAQFTTDVSAKIDILDPTARISASYSGPINYGNIKGATTQVSIYATGGPGNPSLWRAPNSVGSVVGAFSITGQRRRAFFVS